MQSRRNTEAALKLMRKLLRKQGFAPETIVTDELRSYGAAIRQLGLSTRHEQGQRINNRAENSHQPTRRRERKMQRSPLRVDAQFRHELRLIADLDYAPYFLTVHAIVRFARSRNVLCQGRGSAANSAVCFVLGVTAVDPERSYLLFERFISAERCEPPDIDVDLRTRA